MSTVTTHVYGDVPRDLAEVAAGAVQCSPRVPGAVALEDIAAGSSAGLVMHAPANAVERRREMALALTALAPDAVLTVLAHNTRGGNRIADELAAFGCTPTAGHKRHHRIVRTLRGTAPLTLEAAIAEGAPRFSPSLGLSTQAGLFSSEHLDAGSALLIAHLPALEGRGADLGCGIGVLARRLRELAPKVAITLIDSDRRALAVASENVAGDGITTLWTDVRADGRSGALPAALDFVVSNPPFHDGGSEDKALGQAFLTAAARMLKPGGVLWLVANRHLPYEATLKPLFERIEKVAETGGYKVYAATTALARSAARPAVRKAAR